LKKAIVIGSGFAGMSAAAFLAKKGLQVTVLEKHTMPGGRARQLKADGFTFDMGPSWYWMPDVFEKFFEQFDKSVVDYYKLERLDPSYSVYFKDERVDIPSDYAALKKLFERLEPGSSTKLDRFLKEAAFKYNVGIKDLVYKPGRSLIEFLNIDFLKGVFKLDVFTSIETHINKLFKNNKIRQLLAFPVLFLGALPSQTPALYSLMNYADIKLGTWYPKGGMFKIVAAMYSLCKELGVTFIFGADVNKLSIKENDITSVAAYNACDKSSTIYEGNVIVGAADYQFIETKLLPAELRSYSETYWNSRVMAPSCLIYYVGLNKKLVNITHHSLFFDVSFEKHGEQIYTKPSWPDDPLFYVSATSVTDESVAPQHGENLFFLIPVASGLTGDTEELRDKYFEMIVERYENHIGQKIKDSIVYKKSFGPDDFVTEYNAFRGNAYGLANTLKQTAILKPSCKSNKVKNLFYTGQLTVPGPGVPPAIISGEVVANEVYKYLNK
jgi:phytoene desaturase